jgi:hypothetical protein
MYGTAGIDTARLDEGEQLVSNEVTNPLAPVGDIARLKSWAIEAAVARYRDRFGRPVWPWWGGPIVMFDGSVAPVSTATTSGPSARDYSQTPTQVAGVDEGDRVKTDGSHLFAIAGDGIDVVVEFIPSTVKVFDYALAVDVLGVGDCLLSIPVTAECVISPLKLAAREVPFGSCFIRFPYEKELTLINTSSQVHTKYEVLPQMPYSHCCWLPHSLQLQSWRSCEPASVSPSAFFGPRGRICRS